MAWSKAYSCFLVATLGLGLGCGDDGSGTTAEASSGSTLSTGADGEASTGTTGDPGGSSGDGSSAGAPGDTTGSDSSEGGSTTEGGGLVDPEVFRTPDDADVCGPTPSEPCTPGDMAWVASEYGMDLSRADDAWIQNQGAVYRLIALVERVGPSNIDVFVIDEGGAPLTGIPVAFYYDSLESPSRPDEWYPVKVESITDVQGRAGFALGPGAYLDDCGGGGPHAIWVSEPGGLPDTTMASDLADRLGMLGGTDHRHLDLLYQRLTPEAEPGAGRCPLGE